MRTNHWIEVAFSEPGITNIQQFIVMLINTFEGFRFLQY